MGLKDELEGRGKEAAGKIKEAAGNVTGDESLKMRGKMESEAGHAEHETNSVMDSDDTGTDNPMPDRNQVKGAAEQMKGKAKETLGNATDNTRMEAEGKAEQMKGKAQQTYGDVKNKLGDNN
jgi:uncharacterized protein YjbJ (UPF0337 family)